MAMSKLMIPIQGDFVAPRFDLATEIILASFDSGGLTEDYKRIIMEKPSDEELCHMVVDLHISHVVCGGIEEMYYNFLVWKNVVVIDAVIGHWREAMKKVMDETLESRHILGSCREGYLDI